MRLEIMNQIDGVEFSACFARREIADFDGVPGNVISLADLKKISKPRIEQKT